MFQRTSTMNQDTQASNYSLHPQRELEDRAAVANVQFDEDIPDDLNGKDYAGEKMEQLIQMVNQRDGELYEFAEGEEMEELIRSVVERHEQNFPAPEDDQEMASLDKVEDEKMPPLEIAPDESESDVNDWPKETYERMFKDGLIPAPPSAPEAPNPIPAVQSNEVAEIPAAGTMTDAQFAALPKQSQTDVKATTENATNNAASAEIDNVTEAVRAELDRLQMEDEKRKALQGPGATVEEATPMLDEEERKELQEMRELSAKVKEAHKEQTGDIWLEAKDGQPKFNQSANLRAVRLQLAFYETHNAVRHLKAENAVDDLIDHTIDSAIASLPQMTDAEKRIIHAMIYEQIHWKTLLNGAKNESFCVHLMKFIPLGAPPRGMDERHCQLFHLEFERLAPDELKNVTLSAELFFPIKWLFLQLLTSVLVGMPHVVRECKEAIEEIRKAPDPAVTWHFVKGRYNAYVDFIYALLKLQREKDSIEAIGNVLAADHTKHSADVKRYVKELADLDAKIKDKAKEKKEEKKKMNEDVNDPGEMELSPSVAEIFKNMQKSIERTITAMDVSLWTGCAKSACQMLIRLEKACSTTLKLVPVERLPGGTESWKTVRKVSVQMGQMSVVKGFKLCEEELKKVVDGKPTFQIGPVTRAAFRYERNRINEHVYFHFYFHCKTCKCPRCVAV